MGDLQFLMEMKERFDKGRDGDDTQFDYVNQMLEDWISELEQKESYDSN